MRIVKYVLVLCLILAGGVFAAPAGKGSKDVVLVRVVDVGAGLCCVVTVPGDDGPQYLIFDAGGEDQGNTAAEAIEELIPEGKPIALLVISHSDTDHLCAVDEICDAYQVREIIHSGLRRSTDSWEAARKAIAAEVKEDGCKEINLATDTDFRPGSSLQFGDVAVKMISGYSKPPKQWGALNQSESRNAGSVVMRLEYKTRSILFCGDTVGRHIDDPEDACIAAEKAMVDQASTLPLKSDVLIGPHHGADNASSVKFIEAVRPRYVVFSAGHKYDHPRFTTVERYLDFGVPLNRIFRTDLGDDESDNEDLEWDHGRIAGHKHQPREHDIDIQLPAKAPIRVRYRGTPAAKAPK